MAQLRKHISLKHSLDGIRQEGGIQCKVCGVKEKWHLMRHRKSQHITNVAPCKNEKVGTCIYSAEKCWWNHDLGQDLQNESIKCFICNETFERKADMMSHRKRNHASYIRKCLQFARNNCSFKNNSCWYQHDEEMETDASNENENVNKQKQEENESVFQKVSPNPKPPIKIQEKQKVD